MAPIILVLVIANARLNYQAARVDVLELNYVLGDDGKARFAQIITYRWMPFSCRHTVAEWMMVDPKNVLVVPADAHRLRVTWRSNSNVIYDATCGTFRMSRTRNDPELDDRAVVPCERRIPYFETVK